MHVGMASIFQNPGKHTSDQEVYQQDLRLACLAEPLGFDSVWTVEHHFTDYTMCPDPLQFLTYMAGRTQKVKLGSMVVVLPWHDPMRVAEQISVLDHLSGGRLILGLGRGAGRVEFDRFRQDMGDSRPRFVESAECVLQGLEQGYCEYQGQFVQQPRADIRPAPYLTFKGRTYAAAVSPESLPIMAKLGVGLLVIPQKPWDAVEKEIAEYKVLYQQLNGEEPPAPILAGWTFVDQDRDRAYECAKRYIGGYWQTVLDHYEFGGDHLKGQKGYDLLEIRTGRRIPYLRREGEPDAERAGPFFFGSETLDLARAIIREADPRELLIVDEVGPLELRGGGLWPALREIVAAPGRRSLIVVREGILEDFVAALGPGVPLIFDVRNPNVRLLMDGSLLGTVKIDDGQS